MRLLFLTFVWIYLNGYEIRSLCLTLGVFDITYLGSLGEFTQHHLRNLKQLFSWESVSQEFKSRSQPTTSNNVCYTLPLIGAGSQLKATNWLSFSSIVFELSLAGQLAVLRWVKCIRYEYILKINIQCHEISLRGLLVFLLSLPTVKILIYT